MPIILDSDLAPTLVLLWSNPELDCSYDATLLLGFNCSHFTCSGAMGAFLFPTIPRKSRADAGPC